MMPNYELAQANRVITFQKILMLFPGLIIVSVCYTLAPRDNLEIRSAIKLITTQTKTCSCPKRMRVQNIHKLHRVPLIVVCMNSKYHLSLPFLFMELCRYRDKN